jgi:hypothetical protein
VTLPRASATGPTAKEARANCATSPRHRGGRAGLPRSRARDSVDFVSRDASPSPVVMTELPKRLPAMRDELAIWKAFLSTEIDAIMRDKG